MGGVGDVRMAGERLGGARVGDERDVAPVWIAAVRLDVAARRNGYSRDPVLGRLIRIGDIRLVARQPEGPPARVRGRRGLCGPRERARGAARGAGGQGPLYAR